jgi:hypothetical protein
LSQPRPGIRSVQVSTHGPVAVVYRSAAASHAFHRGWEGLVGRSRSRCEDPGDLRAPADEIPSAVRDPEPQDPVIEPDLAREVWASAAVGIEQDEDPVRARDAEQVGVPIAVGDDRQSGWGPSRRAWSRPAASGRAVHARAEDRRCSPPTRTARGIRRTPRGPLRTNAGSRVARARLLGTEDRHRPGLRASGPMEIHPVGTGRPNALPRFVPSPTIRRSTSS